jgi:DNA end-binding protein Ku
MVSIPVGLYPAVKEKDVAFHQIHTKTKSRIQIKKFCPTCKEPVPADEIERGYEYSKGHYITVTDDDLASLPVPSKHVIEIDAFVKAEEVDPVYFDRTYYVQPEKVGHKPYAVLLKVLKSKAVSAVAKVAFSNKEHLCLLRAAGRHIVLETLFYPDEIKEVEDLGAKELEIAPKELQMAETLVEMLTDEFDPSKYHDTYREALLGLIESKAEGHEIKEVSETKPQTEVIDLMAALKASVQAAKRSRSS